METMTSSPGGCIHVMGPLTGKDFTDCSNNLCIAVTITDKSCAFLLLVMKFKCHFLLAVTGDCLPNFSSVIYFFPLAKKVVGEHLLFLMQAVGFLLFIYS